MPSGMTKDYASSLLAELIPEEVRGQVNAENEGDLLAKELRKKKLAELLMRLLMEGADKETSGMEWKY